MNISIPKPVSGRSGYALMEALVYIGLVMLVLGAAYMAAYRSIDNSFALRRNAEDIVKAVNIGEQWRADIRSAREAIRLLEDSDAVTLEVPTTGPTRTYRFSDSTLLRRIGDGPWVRLVTNVKSSYFRIDHREGITAWRWELELQPRTKGAVKGGRVRPLFTFIAVPKTS